MDQQYGKAGISDEVSSFSFYNEVKKHRIRNGENFKFKRFLSFDA